MPKTQVECTIPGDGFIHVTGLVAGQEYALRVTSDQAVTVTPKFSGDAGSYDFDLRYGPAGELQSAAVERGDGKGQPFATCTP